MQELLFWELGEQEFSLSSATDLLCNLKQVIFLPWAPLYLFTLCPSSLFRQQNQCDGAPISAGPFKATVIGIGTALIHMPVHFTGRPYCPLCSLYRNFGESHVHCWGGLWSVGCFLCSSRNIARTWHEWAMSKHTWLSQAFPKVIACLVLAGSSSVSDFCFLSVELRFPVGLNQQNDSSCRHDPIRWVWSLEERQKKFITFHMLGLTSLFRINLHHHLPLL